MVQQPLLVFLLYLYICLAATFKSLLLAANLSKSPYLANIFSKLSCKTSLVSSNLLSNKTNLSTFLGS